MTNIQLNGDWFGIQILPAEGTVYAASKTEQLVGVFTSPLIDGGESLLEWNTMSLTATYEDRSHIQLFFKANDDTAWVGPYDAEEDIDLSDINGRFLQVRIVLLYKQGIVAPSVQKLSITALSTAGSSTFMTKHFETGFVADYVLLTYNGTVPNNALVEFAVCGKDEDDISEYQVIEPNVVTKLTDFPIDSTGIKIAMVGSGPAQSPFVIDEFAIMFSSPDGEKKNLNE